MKLRLGLTDFEISNADSTIFFNNGHKTRRLSVTLTDVATNIENIAALKDSTVKLIKDDNTIEEFVNYQMDNIRKNYISNQVSIDFTKKDVQQ